MAIRPAAFLALGLDAVVLLLVAGSLPAFAASFGVPQDQAGLVFTANGLGFVVMVPIFGVLADRHGKRAVTAIGAAVFALGLFAFAAAPDLALGLCGAALAGAGAGAVESGVTSLLPELYPGREGFANNFAQAFFGAGATGAPLLLLLPGSFWRLRLGLCGLALLLVGTSLWTARHADGPGRARGADWAGLLAVLRAPGAGAVVAGMVLYTGVEVAVWGWLFAVVTGPGGAGPAWAVAELSGFWGAMTAGRLLSGAVAERFDLALLIGIEAAAGVPALLLAILLPSRVGAFVASLVCGLAFAGIWPSLVGLGQKRHGQTGATSALLVAAGGGGSLAIPAAFGFARARLGLGPAAGGLALLLTPVVFLPRRPAPRSSG